MPDRIMNPFSAIGKPTGRGRQGGRGRSVAEGVAGLTVSGGGVRWLVIIRVL